MRGPPARGTPGTMSRFFVLAVLLAVPGTAQACRCVARPPAALARAADAVVIAEVTGQADDARGTRHYRLHVRRSWKVPLAGPLAVESEGTTCRAVLIPGGRYLIYLRRTPRGYGTDACAGNRPIDRATAVIAGLGRPARAR